MAGKLVVSGQGPTEAGPDVSDWKTRGEVGSLQLSQPRGRLARMELHTWLPTLTVGAGPPSREVASGQDLEEEHSMGQTQQLREEGESLCFDRGVGSERFLQSRRVQPSVDDSAAGRELLPTAFLLSYS